jgi:hypothetical protein
MSRIQKINVTNRKKAVPLSKESNCAFCSFKPGNSAQSAFEFNLC